MKIKAIVRYALLGRYQPMKYKKDAAVVLACYAYAGYRVYQLVQDIREDDIELPTPAADWEVFVPQFAEPLINSVEMVRKHGVFAGSHYYSLVYRTEEGDSGRVGDISAADRHHINEHEFIGMPVEHAKLLLKSRIAEIPASF